MAKIKLRAGKDAVKQAEAGDWGEPPKPNLYHLKLEEVAQQDNKDGDGKHLRLRWRPVGVGREGKKPEERLGAVWDRVSLSSDAAEWSRARLAIALGGKPNRAGNVELNLELDETKPGSPVGTVVLGRVQRDEDLEGNYRPKLGWYGPLDATPEDNDEGGFGEDEDEAEEESDEEEAAEPFGEEDEDELLTQKQLENMENKELGGVAKDFDLDPYDFTKKVKGKTVVKRDELIEAILEAQGGEEDSDSDGDEDPF